jgi:hypothetical protein
MGKPEYLNSAMVAELNAASLVHEEALGGNFSEGVLSFEVTMPPLAVAVIRFSEQAPSSAGAR